MFIPTKQLIAIGLITIALIEMIRAIKSGGLRSIFIYLKQTHWKAAGLYLLGILLVVFPLVYLDPMLRSFIQSHYPFSLNGFVALGKFLGRNIWFCIIIAYGLAFLFFRKMIPWVVGVLLGTALTGLAVHIFKYLFMRARPDADLGHLYFFHYSEAFHQTKSFLSMPSGDVAITAGAFSFIIFNLKKGWSRWILLIFPIATALSRILLNRHWPADTLASLLLSFLIGYWLARFRQTPPLKPVE